MALSELAVVTILLLSFTVVLIRLGTIDWSMQCACFGKVIAGWSGGGIGFGIARNVVMLAVLLAAWKYSPSLRRGESCIDPIGS